MKRVLALAAVLAFAAPAAAEVDFTEIAARVDAQAPVATGRAHRAYEALQGVLARPDVPGLGDDFAKLRAVAARVENRLSEDTVLANALGDALLAAQDELHGAAADLVQLASALDAEQDRERCGARSARGTHLAARSDVARADGRMAACAALGRRAARSYADGLALAAKLLARQDQRPPSWSVPLHDLGGALLGVWAEPGPTPAIYAVGADDGAGPLFLRKGGEGWVRIPVASSGTLWWVNGVGSYVYAAGTGGRVIRYDPQTGGVTDLSTGVDVTLYGVWGSSTDDVWAVGGNVGGEQPRTALFHHDGEQWTSVPQPLEANNRTLFKVWGTATDDVWVCGQAGLLLHWDGGSWTAVPSGTFDSLFTVHGAGTIVAVGGSVSPALVESTPQGFTDVTLPDGTNTLRGVFVPPADQPWACGLGATVLRRSNGGWLRIGGLPAASSRDFHAVCVDGAGGVWLAGGDLVQNDEGVLMYYGTRSVPTGVYPQAKLRERVAPALYLSCAVTACHVGPFISEDLDLSTPEKVIAQSVGVPSRQSPLLRVLPGRPSQSYLWHKMSGTQADVGGSGDRMPQGGPFLSPDEMDAIRAWILEGARDN
jgi:hypothetical protein